MMLGVDGHLHVVTHDARASAACGHRMRIRVSKRYLLVRRGQHLHIECLQPLHLFFQLCELLFEASGLRRARQRRLLPVCAIELVQIARDALLDLPHSPLHFGAREILVPIIDCLELAAVNRDASFDEEAHGAAEHNKPAANLADS